MAPAYRRADLGIGYAPEERRLVSGFTVLDNLLVPAWARRMSKREIGQRLDIIVEVLPEIHALHQRLGGLLSGGQQKMVALGRALMTGENLVLLDEPFQGLAPALAQTYAAALRRLRAKLPSLSILITESNPNLVRSLADEVVVLERGEIKSER